jgi:hypothetical protein
MPYCHGLLNFVSVLPPWQGHLFGGPLGNFTLGNLSEAICPEVSEGSGDKAAGP